MKCLIWEEHLALRHKELHAFMFCSFYPTSTRPNRAAQFADR
jgi:hypothetical protein